MSQQPNDFHYFHQVGASSSAQGCQASSTSPKKAHNPIMAHVAKVRHMANVKRHPQLFIQQLRHQLVIVCKIVLRGISQWTNRHTRLHGVCTNLHSAILHVPFLHRPWCFPCLRDLRRLVCRQGLLFNVVCTLDLSRLSVSVRCNTIIPTTVSESQQNYSRRTTNSC